MTNRNPRWRFFLLLIACWSISSLLHAQSIQGLVVSIADGDTLTVLDAQKVQHKIRLAGIDTPERRQPFGQRAREALSALVFQKVVLVLTEKKDSQSCRKEDPCESLLTKYTDCVAAHSRGLSEGDDCGAEAKVYKECRREQKALKTQTTSN